MANARRVTVEILGDAKGAKKAVSETESALGRLSVRGRIASQGLSVIGTGLKGLGVAAAGFGIATGAAMVAAGRSVVKLGIDYQNQLNTMQAVTHATDAVMQQVAKTSRDLGNDLSLPATSAADAARAMTELAKGNLSAQQAMQAAKGTLQLAAAAQIDGAQAATIQARALNAFGLSATSAGHVADALANTANAASGEITDFALGLAQSSAVAHQFGLSLDDTLTALGEFANAGIAGSDAGTSLKTALQSLAGASGPAKKALQTLGVDAFDSQGKFVGLRKVSEELASAQKHMSTEAFNAAVKLAFGSDAARAAGIFAQNGAVGFDKMAAAVGRAGGAAQVAQAKTKGLGGAFQGLQSQLETVKIDVFTKEAPNLEKFIRALSAKLPAAAEAGLRGLDKLTSAVEGEVPKARKVVEEFGPAVETWVSGKLELVGHAADEVAGPALRGIGNILRGLAPQAEGAGKAIDSGLRAAIDSAGSVARQFEQDSSSLGASVGALAGSVGHAAHDALPALKVALAGAAGAANILLTSLSGAAGILAPFAGDALIAVAAIKGISLASAGFSGAAGVVGKVTTAYGAMADKASFAAGVVTQRVGTALGKDLNAAAAAGATAMTGARSAFTALGGAAVVASAAIALLGYAHQHAAQETAQNIAFSKQLYDSLRQGGDAATDAQAKIGQYTAGLKVLEQQGGVTGGMARKLAGDFAAGKQASDEWYGSLSEVEKVNFDVQTSQTKLTDAIHQFGPASDQAKAAAIPFNAALTDQRNLQLALGDATARSSQTLADYTDQIIGAASANVALAGQEISIRQSELSLASASAVAADAMARYGKNSTQAKTASLGLAQQEKSLEGQIYGAAEAAKQAAIANDKSGVAAHAAAAGAAAERAELAKLAAGLAPGSPLRQRIQGLISDLDRAAAPRTQVFRFQTVGTPPPSIRGGTSFVASVRAAGGPVTAGQPYIVGERRPELFVPDQNGRIVPKVPSAARGGSSYGGGGNTYHITQVIASNAHPAEVGRATVEAIVAYEKRSGTRWRS